MGLVDIHDDVLEGLSNIAFEKNMPVENLIETVVQDYTRTWETKKTNKKRQQLAEQQALQGRKFNRQQADWDDNFHFQLTEDESNKKFPGKLKDISTNGLSFSFASEYHIRDDLSFCSQPINVSFESPVGKHTIRFCMTPRHIRKEGNQNIVGLSFSNDECDYHDFVLFLNLVEQQAMMARKANTMRPFGSSKTN